MKHYFVIFILLLFACNSMQSQSIQQVQLIALPEIPAAFSIDPMGAVYVVSDNGGLVKYDSTGIPVSIPGRKTKSSEWQIDASNPYKIIVFNRDLQLADIYNAQLAKINSIDFTSLETGDIALLCGSYDNSFWTLSSSNMELVRFSEQLIPTSKTNLSLAISEADFAPDIMMESDSRLLIAQRGGSAYLFDLYGNLLIHYPEKAESWVFDNGILYYLQNDQIHAYHVQLQHHFVLLASELKLNDFFIRSQMLALQYDRTIDLSRLIPTQR